MENQEKGQCTLIGSLQQFGENAILEIPQPGNTGWMIGSLYFFNPVGNYTHPVYFFVRIQIGRAHV